MDRRRQALCDRVSAPRTHPSCGPVLIQRRRSPNPDTSASWPSASPAPRRRLCAVAFLVLLSPAVYSYSATMLQPSSLPLGVRSVEWLRTHHGNWLVDEVEHVYYTWKAPAKGGPQLKALPAVGTGRPVKPSGRDSAWPPPNQACDR